MRSLFTTIFAIALFSSWTLPIYGQSRAEDPLYPLRAQLQAELQKVDAEVGVSVIAANGDTLTLNNATHYPLMSVFKLHQAIALCGHLAKKGITLDSLVEITSNDLCPNTYSPLKKRYPQGNLRLSIAQLLGYTIRESDNIVCDLLFNRLMSPSETEIFLKNQLDIKDFQIRYDEKQMQQDHSYCYENWTTPYAAALLVKKLLDGEVLNESHRIFIQNLLLNCQTGANKLPLPLTGTGAKIGHKTGTGPTTSEGIQIANNDLGFVQDGQGKLHYIIAVFVKDSSISPEQSDQIISTLSDITFHFFKRQ